MEFIRGLPSKKQQDDCIATIGNFDGVHLGHQAIIRQLQGLSARLGLPTTIIIFEPQPREFFSPCAPSPRLSKLRDKLALFAHYGVDRVICLRFDRKMAEQGAAAFVETVLCQRIGVRALIVGDDFRFGKDREGNFALLQQMGRARGFDVFSFVSFCVEGERISSTLVRAALHAGNIDRVNKLLGRPYRMSGRVVYGEGRGRRLGYPTANIELYRHQPPALGIFAVRVYGLEEGVLDAVAYIGRKPVFRGDREVLEVHIFDFNRAIYGRRLEIEMISKIREEGYFDSEEALLIQMARDVEQARIILRPDQAYRHVL